MDTTIPTTLGVKTEAELNSQPECWLTASEAAREAPALEGHLALAGCGTSYYMLAAWGQRREMLGKGRADAFVASQLPPREYDELLVLSRSGTTKDVIDVLKRSAKVVPASAGIVGVPDSPIAELVDTKISIDFADEVSVVQTRFATTALAYLRAIIGDDIAALAEQAQAVLTGDIAPVPLDCQHLVFLGHEWAGFVAQEAALKVREGAQIFAEAYLAEEYEHGPIALAGPGTVVWAMGELDEAIATAVRGTGAQVVNAKRDPHVELVALHRYMLAAARHRRIDTDNPRFLSRSVA